METPFEVLCCNNGVMCTRWRFDYGDEGIVRGVMVILYEGIRLCCNDGNNGDEFRLKPRNHECDGIPFDSHPPSPTAVASQFKHHNGCELLFFWLIHLSS